MVGLRAYLTLNVGQRSVVAQPRGARALHSGRSKPARHGAREGTRLLSLPTPAMSARMCRCPPPPQLTDLTRCTCRRELCTEAASVFWPPNRTAKGTTSAASTTNASATIATMRSHAGSCGVGASGSAAAGACASCWYPREAISSAKEFSVRGRDEGALHDRGGGAHGRRQCQGTPDRAVGAPPAVLTLPTQRRCAVRAARQGRMPARLARALEAFLCACARAPRGHSRVGRPGRP